MPDNEKMMPSSWVNQVCTTLMIDSLYTRHNKQKNAHCLRSHIEHLFAHKRGTRDPSNGIREYERVDEAKVGKRGGYARRKPAVEHPAWETELWQLRRRWGRGHEAAVGRVCSSIGGISILLVVAVGFGAHRVLRWISAADVKGGICCAANVFGTVERWFRDLGVSTCFASRCGGRVRLEPICAAHDQSRDICDGSE
jgi:hypothetical protein